MNWESRVWLFDFEVFKHDWMLVTMNLQTQETFYFWNDNIAVANFMLRENPLLCGYNNKSYDNYILRGIMNDFDNTKIKYINDHIIGGGKGWTIAYPFMHRFDSTDLILDISPPKSLKEIEGNMGMNIVECTVPFDIERPLTQLEREEVFIYCSHDVAALMPLFEARKPYLDAKVDVGNMIGLNYSKSLYFTNSQLTAKYLSAKFVKRDDEREYTYPSVVDPELLPLDVRNFIALLWDSTVPSEKLFDKSLDFMIADCPHTFGWGGLHGALPNYLSTHDTCELIFSIDVTSYYPSLMIEYNYLSRNVPSYELFISTYFQRIQAKKEKNTKLADALKLVLNTTYGSQLNPYSDLYDPLMARSICITGQVLLILLIQELDKIPSVKLIQSNTDGLIIGCASTVQGEVAKVISEWESKYRMNMDIELIDFIVQKDVNNYIVKKENGKLKTKGSYVKDFEPDFLHHNMPIVAKAIVDYFVHDIPVMQTIESCTDPLQFQIIAKTGRTYQKVVHVEDLGNE